MYRLALIVNLVILITLRELFRSFSNDSVRFDQTQVLIYKQSLHTYIIPNAYPEQK